MLELCIEQSEEFMHTLSVQLPFESYNISIGRNILDLTGEIVQSCTKGTRALIVTHPHLNTLYGTTVKDSLLKAGFSVCIYEIPEGEHSKSFEKYHELLTFLSSNLFSRNDVVIALGGGVIGDVAGFTAATYMRGCALIQIPTSLLAMIDSSIGGKTAINLPVGKNLVGAFYNPSGVIISLDTLDSISLELLQDSCGELIKYGVLSGKKLINQISLAQSSSHVIKTTYRQDLIESCLTIKKNIIEKDFKESNVRKTLNLGHTIGHGLELLCGFSLGHGACVATGIALIAKASYQLGLCPFNDLQQIVSITENYGLPTSTSFSIDELYHAVLHDKKIHNDSIDLVLIHGIGNVCIEEKTLKELHHVLELALQ